MSATGEEGWQKDRGETKRSATLPLSVVSLGTVSLLNDASSEMIYPLLPVFLRTHLGASLPFVGLVEGIAELVSSLMKLTSGWLADRFGRHKLITFIGYLIAAVTRPLMAWVQTPTQVLVLRFVDRTGKGIRTSPRDALLAACAPPTKRGLAFGFHRSMDNLGALIGPVLAWLLLIVHPNDYRTVFLWAAVPAFLSLFVLYAFVPNSAPSRPPSPSPSSPAPTVSNPSLIRVFSHKSFRWFLLSIFLFSLGNSSDAFLLLRATEAGLDPQWVPLLWALLNGVRTLSATPCGALSDRLGRVQSIVAGWLIYSVVYFGFAFAFHPIHPWFLMGCYGLYFGLTEGPERALVADLVGPGERGTAFSLYHSTVGLSLLPASVLFGLLWHHFGSTTAFLTGSTLALMASAILIGKVKK
ncbi:MAG: MFS transporter [Armatimonadetes bacterium]|nr:MFS transporter [Armatimonadota bacterium]MDW8121123.1 MFS transporter [Armatimonadota bacterium]